MPTNDARDDAGRQVLTARRPATFEARTGGDRDTFVIALYGELDLSGEGRMQAACRQAIEAGTSQIVVDLSSLSHIDSTGLTALVTLSRLAQACQVQLSLLPGPPQIQRVFEICGLMEVLSFGPDGSPSA